MERLARLLRIHTVLPVALFPVIAFSQDVDEVFDGLVNSELASYASVENYLLQTETMGMSTVEFYERTSSFEKDGKTYYIMRNVPMNELAQRQTPQSPISSASSAELRSAAQVIEDQGVVMEAEFKREFENSGLGSLGGGLFGTMIMNPPPDQPWLSPNPRDMTSMYATMLRGAADGQDAQAAQDPVADAETAIDQMAQAREATEIVGRGTIDGRPAIEMLTDDLNMTQYSEDGQEFNLNKMTMWVDAERYVPLRMKMDGIMRFEGETREISIERNDLDYQLIEGCGDMYKPMRSVMRLGGIMTPEQEAQMREAQAELAGVEEQLAQMPADQREMVMRQMGPQLEMMRNMGTTGAFEVETRVIGLTCNTTAPNALEIAMATLNATPVAGLSPAALMTEPPANSTAVVTTPEEDPDLRAAQQACLQEKVQEAEAAQQTRRGIGRLLSAVTRTAEQIGYDITRATEDIFSANATADDLSAAARDLGLTEDDVDDCRNPM